MEDLETDEICDRCKEPFRVLIAEFEQIMKEGDPVLCPECEAKFLDEQTETVPKRCFDYFIIPIEGCDLNEYGKIGWELIIIDNGQAYFKREYLEERQ